MFTLEQIEEAHSQVKSGADFPAYIRKIKTLGVTYYETYVSDGHTDYYGTDGYKITSLPKYDVLNIAERANDIQFKKDLKAHQEGKTDYFMFCDDASKSGIEKWTVCAEEMTCTYYDKAANKILVEKIP